MNNYQNELEFAKKLALQAGQIIVDNFAKTSSVTIKTNITPVTKTDIAVSKLVATEVKKTFPKHTLLDEEISNQNTDAEYKWICDPIDGTIPFSRNIPTSMFSLALCKNDEPVVAVIYDPYMKRLLYVTLDSDLYQNEMKIQCNNLSLTPGEVILTIPNWFKNFDHNKFFQFTKDKKYIFTTVESFVYQCMLVANGSVVTAIMAPSMPWDRAASKLIIEKAGGLLTDETGQPLTVFGEHKMAIAANQVVHKEILQIVNNCLIK